jgi:PAS domain S-box-containing protein
VETERSARRALERVQGGEFDAIVVDYQMPEINGLELLKIIRAQGNDIPFILFTGKGREDVAIEALNEGADFYLQKGGDPRSQFVELVNLIRQSVERKRSIQALHESERKYRQLIELANEGIWSIDADGVTSFVNPRMADMLGYTVEEMLGKPFFSFIDEAGIAIARRNIELRKQGISEEHGFDLIHKNGSRIHVTTGTSTITDSTGVYRGALAVVTDVTKRVKAEEELRSALAKRKDLEEIITRSPAVVFLWRTTNKWNVDFVSDNIRQFGYTPEDFLSGRITYSDVVHPGDMERIKTELEEFAQKGVVEFEQEYRIVTKSGDVRWVYDRTFRRVESEGVATHHEGIIVDITDRKRAEKALEENERFMSLIFSSIQDGISILDRDMNIVRVNPAMERWYAHAMPLVGKKCYDAYHSRTKVCDVCPTRQTLRTGKTAREIVPLAGPKGKTVGWLDLYSFPMLDPSSGELIGVIEYVRDDTERKRAEEALRENQRLLTEAQRIGDLAFWRWDIAKNTSEWSNELYSLYGVKPEGFSVSSEGYLDLVHPDDCERVRGMVEKALHDCKSTSYDFRIVRPDGEVRHMSSTVEVKVGETGKPVEVMGINVDITDRKHYEDALKQANEKLQLLGSVTRHDGLNQLAILEGWMGIARGVVEDKAVLQYLEKMNAAAKALQGQLEFTADYQEMGVKNPEWIPVEPALLRGVAGLNLGDISIVHELGGLEIYADPMLDKVFRNLVENAIRHGEKVSKITLSFKKSKDAVTISLEDDGVGIPESEKKLSFEPRYGKHTGYGLFMTRSILEITGIGIEETGMPGKGAKFEIRVPAGKFRFAPEKKS